MRTRSERRDSETKKEKKRIDLCKEKFGYENVDEEYLKHKTDVPHSHGSNWWNAYETKKMNNKKERLKEKQELKQENFESKD